MWGLHFRMLSPRPHPTARDSDGAGGAATATRTGGLPNPLLQFSPTHRIGFLLFRPRPRKTQPREPTGVGGDKIKSTTGKAGKSCPTWRPRPCSFSPVPCLDPCPVAPPPSSPRSPRPVLISDKSSRRAEAAAIFAAGRAEPSSSSGGNRRCSVWR